MFLPTRGTPYDLRFSLFRIPVTISPFFWVTSAILGWYWLTIEPGGPANLVAWILCVLVSILVHEFGHALTMRAFGHWPEVVLHHFGGYATYRGRETPWRSLLITAAGPGVQFLLFGLLLASSLWVLRNEVSWVAVLLPQNFLNVQWIIPDLLSRAGVFGKGTPLYAMMSSLLFINLFWPLLNLLPVFPLDGGRILQSVLTIAGVRASQNWTLKVGVALGTIVAVYFLLQGNFIAGAMFAFMAMDNYQTLNGQRFGV